MARLFAGRPRRTDGRLTKNNLGREAGVSPGTMFRTKDVLAEWDAHVAEHGVFTSGQAHRDTELRELRRKLADAKVEVTELNHRLSAATTVITALHHDNQLLRAERHHAGNVTELPPRPRD